MLALYQETLISTARRFLPGQSKKKKKSSTKEKAKINSYGRNASTFARNEYLSRVFGKKTHKKKKSFCLFCFDFGVNFLYNI